MLELSQALLQPGALITLAVLVGSIALCIGGWLAPEVTITLLGSSVNLLASEVSERSGYGALGLFSFTDIGLGVWLSGSLVMVLLAARFLPDRGLNNDDLLADLASSGYLSEVEIPARSELIGQSLHATRLQLRYDVDVLELHRDSERFLPPLADCTLELGDRLLLRCSRNDLLRLQQEHTVVLAPTPEQGEEGLGDDRQNKQRVVEVLLPSGSALAGDYLRFRQRYNATVLALLIPVAGQLAVGLALRPLAFVYAVLFGASQSFLSPVGYQTNLMVFGPGRYRFLDIPATDFLSPSP